RPRTVPRPDSRRFQVLSAGFAHNFGHTISPSARLRPRSDPCLVCAMISVFGKSEKFRRFTSAIFFECAPLFRAFVESKSNRRQDLGEKLLRSRPVSHAQIDMIKEATLQSSRLFLSAQSRVRSRFAS